MTRMLTLDDIEALFTQHGQQLYDGSRRESVTALQHALQCAQLAEWAHADDALVAAALLHDLGHFLTPIDGDEEDDCHETIALPYLAGSFGADVLEPIRLHVAAKRYLVATNDAYLTGLSEASVHSLALQGGPMTDFEITEFEATPFAMDAVQLRRWDDLAKTVDQPTPPLSYYLALLASLQPDFQPDALALDTPSERQGA